MGKLLGASTLAENWPLDDCSLKDHYWPTTLYSSADTNLYNLEHPRHFADTCL